MNRLIVICAGLGFGVLTSVALAMEEPPSLADAVKSGELPPMEQRLPVIPKMIDFAAEGKIPGLYGGELRTLMAKAKDIRYITVYGYSRLVGYNHKLSIEPDILRDVEVVEGRIFTLHLREGHRWSDGAPFTTEDFRFWWEDVANNEELAPSGPPQTMRVQGELPKVEVLGETTIRFSWSQSNPYFLPALAGSRPMFIYQPSHYLKQFHVKYTDAEKLQAMADERGVRSWAALLNRMSKQYRFNNPELPTLQPWFNTTPPPSERFVFERNPYYHRTDSDGKQLPYIDKLYVSIASKDLIPAKTGSGDADLQARYLRFDNFTFLKASEKRNDQSVRLWRKALGAQVALYPNLNAEDPVWRKLNRDIRFRHALSLAINRHEINEVVYFGLVMEGNNTVLPQSPLYKPEYQEKWAEFDLATANDLLDEIGLTQRNKRGLRLLPDGRPLEIIVETAGESTEETDVLELIHDSWLDAGIKLYSKPSQREVFRKRIFAGATIMSISTGLDNAIPNADMSPQELAPINQTQLQWPKWGQFFETGGKAGEAPDMPSAQRLFELNTQWAQSTNSAQREAIWHEMLAICAEQEFSIGIVSGVLQPLMVHNQLRNIPEEGLYNWEPGAYFGIYRPDTLWFDGSRRVKSE